MKIVTEARDSTLATCLLERGLVMWNVSLANMEGKIYQLLNILLFIFVYDSSQVSTLS